MKKTIHVAFCIDNAFAIHLAALIHSLGKHLSQNFQLKCHILGRLNEDNIFKLTSLTSQNINVGFYDDFPDYKEIPISSLYNNRLNEVTYYRFAIPEVLHNVEKVVFIDADMIAIGDISTLWSIDMMDAIVAVVSDHILGCDKEKQQVRGISSGRYFNAGFMLMDLRKWRENNISQQALKLLIDNNGFEHNDQDALNIVLQNKVIYLDEKWNVQPNHLAKKDIPEPILVHFCGQEKPWHVYCAHPFKNSYLVSRAETEYACEPLQTYLDQDDMDILSRLKNKFPDGARIVVWGAGQRGRRLCYEIIRNMDGYLIEYIVDKSVSGEFMGVEINNNLVKVADIDAVIIASIPYRDEIIDEIGEGSCLVCI
ncbi:glycosyltransferase family 8 protein [Aeromonas veronii]|uniref:glycosyltransferase family 8 protein n=1 Tax=Aeromonas veronii TaxID=654 RepID=UPI001F36813E|nr:glycosyltransferase family 8 protein [Aeromonas veronii]MCF5839368.1 glycosyltransferase family 8 protein [Aeromonas veronii]MCF5889297.1 glycosyltransferase family 8 protein [Aeromonas veronii]